MATENEEFRQGRLEGMLEEIRATLSEARTEAAENWNRQNIVNANTAAELKTLSGVVERIRKPVDTFIASRNVLMGVAMFLAAIGGIWGYFSGAWHWVYGFFVRS